MLDEAGGAINFTGIEKKNQKIQSKIYNRKKADSLKDAQKLLV